MTEKVGLYKTRCGTETRWKVRWYGRYDPHVGKQKRYSKTFSRKVDAEQFRKDKESEFDGGAQRDPSGATIKEYAEQWLEYRIGFGGIAPATATGYRETFARLYDYFGPNRLLRTIEQRDVQQFLGDLRRKTGTRTKPLSAWAKNRIWRECNTLFGQAVIDGIMSSNPFKLVKAPKCPKTEWFYLPPDGFHRVLRATPTLRERVFYTLCYTAGLRRNEAISLYWTNIDFDKHEVRIVNRDGTEKLPPFSIKDHEARTIPVPKFTIDMLTELMAEAEDGVPFILNDRRRTEQIKIKWQWCQENDRPWENAFWSNNTLRDYKRRVRHAGIDTQGLVPTMHDIRKACITNWARALPMNTVRELAGHSNIQTTATYYLTVTADQQEAAREHAQAMLTDPKLTFSAISEE